MTATQKNWVIMTILLEYKHLLLQSSDEETDGYIPTQRPPLHWCVIIILDLQGESKYFQVNRTTTTYLCTRVVCRQHLLNLDRLLRFSQQILNSHCVLYRTDDCATTKMHNLLYLKQHSFIKIMLKQARRQGGFEGVRSNPPSGLLKILYAPLNCIF